MFENFTLKNNLNKERKKVVYERGLIKLKQPYPKIALVGFRGIGKTTLALELTKYWDTRAISLDDEIERQYQYPITKIVADKGWSFFRDKEAQYLKKINDQCKTPFLLDTGGGILEKEDGSPSHRNMNILKHSFFTIYLHMDHKEAIQRLEKAKNKKTRPNLPKDISKIYYQREAYYQRIASSMVDITNTTIKKSVQLILSNF